MARFKRKVAAAAILLLQEKAKKRYRRRVWVRKWIERSVEGAHVKFLKELLYKDTLPYNIFLCMSPEDYYLLLDKVTPLIKKRRHSFEWLAVLQSP